MDDHMDIAGSAEDSRSLIEHGVASRQAAPGMGALIGIGAGLGMGLGIILGDLVMGMIAGAAVGTVAGAIVESQRNKDR
jgi:uncharacterized membrane protein